MRMVLGIESSCDETAAALVTDDRRILAQAIASQDECHAPYGGVVPEIAARAHSERLAPLIERVLNEAQVALKDVDAVAATAGPGLIGGVMVGLVTAKALAMASDRPLLAINHLEGHALSPRLADPELRFPYALLLVSGGHCQLLRVDGVGRYRRFATTIDDALGEAFDKTAKILGLGFPGGPAVERLAAEGNAGARSARAVSQRIVADHQALCRRRAKSFAADSEQRGLGFADDLVRYRPHAGEKCGRQGADFGHGLAPRAGMRRIWTGEDYLSAALYRARRRRQLVEAEAPVARQQHDVWSGALEPQPEFLGENGKRRAAQQHDAGARMPLGHQLNRHRARKNDVPAP